MNKPNSYDETQLSGEFTPVELGGHAASIVAMEERETKTGKPMVVVMIDFDRTDAQAGYFKESYDNDDREEKKWPYQATQYIVTEDQNGKCSRSFKSFCTAFESSNNTKIAWGGKDWAKQFIGKKIGVVYGEVEEEYNGEVKTRRRIRWFCSYSVAAEATIPMKKFLQQPKTATASADGFMNLPEEDNVPW